MNTQKIRELLERLERCENLLNDDYAGETAYFDLAKECYGWLVTVPEGSPPAVPDTSAWSGQDARRRIEAFVHHAAFQLAKETKALLTPEAVEGELVASETGWLIECVGEQGPLWLADDHEAPRQFLWTADANEAIRFSRECDAESVMACNHIGHGLRVNGEPMRVFVSEHCWPAPLDWKAIEEAEDKAGGQFVGGLLHDLGANLAEAAPDSPVDVGEVIKAVRERDREILNLTDQSQLLNHLYDMRAYAVSLANSAESLTKQLEGLTERLHLHGGLTRKELDEVLAGLKAKGEKP